MLVDLIQVVEKGVNDSKNQEGLVNPFLIYIIFNVDSVHVENDQENIKEMHQAPDHMQLSRVLVPFELNDLSEIIGIKYL